ncbi:MAG: hypothetical protein JXA87_07045 [Thermoleophilia bacterium]|nr:hypothetical protein [Thermoleophilia bacterium]
MRLRSMKVLAVLACGFVVLGVLGCDGRQDVIPSALDTTLIDVTAETGPAELPPLSSGVPAGQVLEMTQRVARSDGSELHSRRWYDFENDRFRWDTFGDPSSALGGPSTTAAVADTAAILFSGVRADGQDISYDGYSGELRGNPAPADAQIDESGGWDTTDTVRLGRQTLSGAEVDVYRVDLNIPRGHERSADFGLVYVESSTGPRLREEWLIGSPGDAWVYLLYEYRLVPLTPELESRLSPQSLIDLAAATIAAYMDQVAKLDFPVWGLPDGAHDLTLSGVRVLESGKGTQVGLSYVPRGQIGVPAVTIETNDIRGRRDFPRSLTGLREEAVAYSGGTDHIDFRMADAGVDEASTYDTSVRILLNTEAVKAGEPLSLGSLAMEITDVRGTTPTPFSTTTTTADLREQLTDGAWSLQVDRQGNTFAAHLPSDFLPEAEYHPIVNGGTLRIAISAEATKISVEGSQGDVATLEGKLTSTRGGLFWYDLDGLFAGGRVVIWQDARGLQGELTIYGSGLAMVSSLRGELEKAEP